MNVALLAQTAGTANVLERARLELNDPGAPVLRLARIRYDANDSPPAYEEVVLQLDRFSGLARHVSATSDIFELFQRHGLLFGRARGRISIVRATGDIALHLGIVVGDLLPGFRTRRYLRDYPPIRREACASRDSRTNRL
jgi:DNA-binding GntR family transcriptional regulator